MKLFTRVFLLCTSLVFVVPAFAQEEEEDDIPVEQVYVPKFTLQFGARRVSSGPKVKFKNLGSMAQRSSAILDENGEPLGRIYDDGAVDFTDEAGPEERRNDTNATIGDTGGETAAQAVDNKAGTKTAGKTHDSGFTKYTVFSGTTPIKSFIGYKTGSTRNWNYSNNSQIDGTDVLMSTYGAESDGGSAEATSSAGTGIELQLAYELGKRGKWEWAVSGGLSLASINAKTSGRVRSTLLKTTDRYHLQATGFNGDTIGQPAHRQPGDAQDLDETEEGNDNDDLSAATPLNIADYDEGELERLAGGAVIDGTWQIKGAYFTMRLGPEFRYRLTERFALSGSFGFAGVYVGTTFKAEETIVNVTAPVRITEEKSTSKFVAGYYVDLNLEYWLTERSGLYAGIGRQDLGDFQQKLRGRSAEIDLGDSSDFRIGIMTKF